MPNWLSILITIVWNLGLLLVQFEVFASGSSAWKATMIGVQLLGNLPAIFGKQLVAGNKPSVPPAALLLLAGALGFGVAVGGCAGLRSVSYKGLTIATDGATGAAEQLPAACEVAELAAAKKQPTKELKISESGKVHADCEATAKALSATHDGLVAARNLVANAPDKASDWARWVLSAVQLYQDVRPLVAKYGIKLPEVKP